MLLPSMPIPTFAGAGATFPKCKVPNDSVITLAVMNNNCLQMFMMGQPLDLASEDSRDLAAYVASLSNGEEVQIGNLFRRTGTSDSICPLSGR